VGKPFQLHWSLDDEARVYATGEWQLRFRDHAGRDFADKRLSRSQWISHQRTPDDEVVYTFVQRAGLSEVMRNLIDSGLPESEIEFVDEGDRKFREVVSRLDKT
jgi:hypothetical protein